MATRRASTARAARLVEGKTYNTQLPRQRVIFSRERMLMGAQYEQSYVATSGQLVPVGEPHRKALQTPVVGSIVALHNERRTFVQPIDRDNPVVNPSGHNTVDRYYFQTQRFDTTTPWVVTAVSQDGKFIRVHKLLHNARGSVTSKQNVLTGKWSITSAGVLRRVADEHGRLQYRNDLLSEDELVSGYRTSWPTVTADDGHGSLARKTYIKHYFDPSDLPPELLRAVRRIVRQKISAALFTRLAALAPGNAMTRRHLDNHWLMGGRQEAKARAMSASLNIRSARQIMAMDPTSEEGRKQALHYLTRAYDAVVAFERAAYGEIVSADKMIRREGLRLGLGDLQRHSCGHFHSGPAVLVFTSVYGETGNVCPVCAAAATQNVYHAAHEGPLPALSTLRFWTWSDETLHLDREPGVMGHRHSGKGIVGYVEPLVKRPRESFLTIGMELEMQAYNGHDREDMIRKMKKRVVDSGVLTPPQLRKFLHFEEDGSTGPGGFEMVTGYTDLPTQDKLLALILNDDRRRPAWSGKLRSHDAQGGSCGIHVHVQKPRSLVHASKIRYFINSSGCAKLVKDVARRYNDGFARINNGLCAEPPQKMAVSLLKSTLTSSGYGRRVEQVKATPAHQKMAIDRINQHSRYEALNFNNANTVEFRIFRGSMLHGTVMASLEFTQAVWNFCRYTPATSLTADNFIAYIGRAENRRETKNLRQYLKRKGWDVWVPRDKNGEAKEEVSAGDESQPVQVNRPRMRRGVPVPHDAVSADLNMVLDELASDHDMQVTGTRVTINTARTIRDAFDEAVPVARQTWGSLVAAPERRWLTHDEVARHSPQQYMRQNQTDRVRITQASPLPMYARPEQAVQFTSRTREIAYDLVSNAFYWVGEQPDAFTPAPDLARMPADENDDLTF